MFIINTSFIWDWEKAISLWISLTFFFSKNLLNLLSLEVMILIFELFRGGLGIKFHVCSGFLLGLQMTFCCYSVVPPFCWEVSHHFNKIEAPCNVFYAFLAMFVTPPTVCLYLWQIGLWFYFYFSWFLLVGFGAPSECGSGCTVLWWNTQFAQSYVFNPQECKGTPSIESWSIWGLPNYFFFVVCRWSFSLQLLPNKHSETYY